MQAVDSCRYVPGPGACPVPVASPSLIDIFRGPLAKGGHANFAGFDFLSCDRPQHGDDDEDDD